MGSVAKKIFCPLKGDSVMNQNNSIIKTLEVVSFGDYNGNIQALKDKGYKVLRYKAMTFNDDFGLLIEDSNSIVVANRNLFLKYFVGKTCNVKVEKSPKLDIEVATAISIVKEEVKDEVKESKTGSNELVEALLNPKEGGNK
jgi:hypothetical protein